MNQWQEMYQKKLRTADECAAMVKDGDGIIASIGNGQPEVFLNAIGKRIRANELRDIFYTGGVDVKFNDLLSPDIQDRFNYNSGFVGDAVRMGVNKGLYTFSSNRMGDSVRILSHKMPHVGKSIVTTVVSAMDEHGYFSSGTHADLCWGAWRSGNFEHLILEVNENMPRSFGNNHFHISEVSALVENNTPMVESPAIAITEKDEIIGKLIAERVPDGACLQIGIGGMPNAVAKYLTEKNDLGVHSEMLADSMVDLFNRGVITGAKKNINRNKMVASFALGSQRLYDFINNNPVVEIHCSSYVNDPYTIGLNDNVVSVNATLEVDLTGQCCSESIGRMQYSGVGGQVDFIRGAWRSKGGQAFLALYSTYTDKEGKVHSRINPTLTPGSIVTTPRYEVDSIVTEYGIATIKGDEMRTRVKKIISIAHPDFREELTFAAKKMNLLR